ncbi:hypothetical protein ACQW02_15415 [Humitalea sp. 24SJ18S-53]|uniref:hypothetical protein n=1 Tax=Humitalea sp. 24SJ18S-53 TaxID=3422307 RepID=UPI003D67FB48
MLSSTHPEDAPAMAIPHLPPRRAMPLRAWCAAAALLAVSCGAMAAQAACHPPSNHPPELGAATSDPASRRVALLDSLLADAEAARALDEAGQDGFARIVMATATGRVEVLLVQIGGVDDPTLGAVLALGTARDVLARIIAAAMLADEIPPDAPQARLARAMALLDWSAHAWRAAMGCGDVVNAVLAARSHGALARADALARDAFATSPGWDAAAVRATAAALAALADLLPTTTEPGEPWLVSPDQLDAAVQSLRASARPLLP